MKFNQLLLLSVLFVFSVSLSAQMDYSLKLKNGYVHPQPNIRKAFIDSFNGGASRFQQKTFAILQFESLPTAETRKLLAANGIELLEYIPNNAYTVSISGNPSLPVLQQARARSILQPSPEQKMDARLAAGIITPSAIKVGGTVDVWISYPKTFSAQEVINNLMQLNVDVRSTQYQFYRIISLRIATNRLKELAALPYIEFVQTAPGGDQALNYNSRYGSRANFLNASLSDGGKGLNGGVHVTIERNGKGRLAGVDGGHGISG